MTDIFIFLVYIGGHYVWSETHGFWSSIFWPLHAGKALAMRTMKELDALHA